MRDWQTQPRNSEDKITVWVQITVGGNDEVSSAAFKQFNRMSQPEREKELVELKHKLDVVNVARTQAEYRLLEVESEISELRNNADDLARKIYVFEHGEIDTPDYKGTYTSNVFPPIWPAEGGDITASVLSLNSFDVAKPDV